MRNKWTYRTGVFTAITLKYSSLSPSKKSPVALRRRCAVAGRAAPGGAPIDDPPRTTPSDATGS